MQGDRRSIRTGRCEPECAPCICLLRRSTLKKIARFLFCTLISSLISLYVQGKWNKFYMNAVKDEILVLSVDVYTKLGAAESKSKETFVQLEAFDSELNKIRYELSGNFVDSISKEVKRIIKAELTTYDADKTGLADYALASLGGCIASTRKTQVFTELCSQLSILGLPLITIESDPKTIIKGPITPGKCWAIAGCQGAVVIQLVAPIRVTNVSIEHIPVELSPTGSISSAPRHFSVWGLQSVDDPEPDLLGKFEYKVPGSPLQMFAVTSEYCKQMFPYVEFIIHSNHGHKDFTCLYRVRVHSQPNTKMYRHEIKREL